MIFFPFLCPPTKDEGGHNGFSVDPDGVGVCVGVCVGVGVSMTNSCTHNIF